MVNVMHSRPRFDFTADYFVKIYRAECVCLRLHSNLIKSILDAQVGYLAFIINSLLKSLVTQQYRSNHNLGFRSEGFFISLLR